MKITPLSCFCTESQNSGNPAAVVENFLGDDHAKQKLVIELNKSNQIPVTVFLHDNAHVRFFYPSSEMNMCVHASLAAAHVVMTNLQSDQCMLKTKTGRNISVFRDQNNFQAILKEEPSKNYPIDIDSLLNSHCELNPNLPSGAYSVGSPKYFIPLNSPDQLDILKPNFESIAQWSRDSGINGLYVYAPINNSGHEFKARGFNPNGGCNEDAATGVAVGALIAALKIRHMTVYQGEHIDFSCRLTATHRKKDIYVGGIVRSE